ncbi:MAG TPA: PKD domain-containing protein, partial [Chitinophagales bacterium]|nr:PKD domain-containing protein [Chitinophagales bacterium]
EVYFPVVSPVTMDDGYGNYEIPVVFFQPPADVFYLKGVTLTDEDFSPDAVADFGYYQLSSSVSFINNSAYALSYSWDFGDGSPVSTLEDPVHDYPSTGNYTVCLTASNQTSSDTSCELINIIGVENLLNDIWSISPVPAHDNLLIGCNCNLQIDHVQLTDLSGKTTTVPCQPAGDGFIADLTEIPSGQYLVSIWFEGQLWVKTLIVL